jgi:hypothetical protein
MVPNLNIAHFARMASPSAASAAPRGDTAPRMPPRPPINPASRMAAQGRGGDSMMAHMTPGEIAVPPQVQSPEVLAALNRAFAQVGANPTSYQAGNPDQKINPATGAPEFGFFDVALPLGLGILGSVVGGPLLGAGLEALSVGPATAGIIGGALGGGLGSTAGNLITGKPLGQSLALGAAGAAGSALGGAALGSGGLFGSGPTPMASVWDKAGALSQSAMPGPIPEPDLGFSAADNFNALAADGIRNPAGMENIMATDKAGGLSSTGLPLTVSGAGVAPSRILEIGLSISSATRTGNRRSAVRSAGRSASRWFRTISSPKPQSPISGHR